jgi:hypothetical protein
MGEGLDGDTGALGTENGTVGGTFDKGACKTLWQTNLTLLLCVYHIITQHRHAGHPNKAQTALPMM